MMSKKTRNTDTVHCEVYAYMVDNSVLNLRSITAIVQLLWCISFELAEKVHWLTSTLVGCLRTPAYLLTHLLSALLRKPKQRLRNLVHNRLIEHKNIQHTDPEYYPQTYYYY